MYEKIKKILAERGMSLRELARQSNVSMHTLYNLKARESGSLSAKNALKIASTLGISVEELMNV